MTSQDGLRVVFTGHTGLNKSMVLNRLCNYIYSQDDDWNQLQNISNKEFRISREKELACVYSSEDLIDEAFLKLSPRDQQRVWRQSFISAVSSWKNSDPKPKCAFLSLHLTFQAYSQFFSPLAWSAPLEEDPHREAESTLIKYLRDEFRPQYCVNVIDDVDVVRKRIEEHGYKFRLIELLRWRNVEMMMTDLLAKLVVSPEHKLENKNLYPFEHSPMLAARHPRSMLYKFLLKPNVPRIYASYPISEPRRIATREKSDSAIQEINSFRRTLHHEFTVFDPVSIDERPLQILLDNHRRTPDDEITTVISRTLSSAKASGDDLQNQLENAVNSHLENQSQKLLTLRPEDRWPDDEQDTLSGEMLGNMQDLPLSEVEEIASKSGEEASEIDRQIRSRDFRLIDQADYVVVYRPTYKKERWSEGTSSEVRYANSIGKRVFVIRDPSNDGKLGSPPFGHDLPPRDVVASVGNLNIPDNQVQAIKKVVKEVKKEFTRNTPRD